METVKIKDCTTCAHCGLEEDKGYCQLCVIEKRPGAVPSEWQPTKDEIKDIPGLDERGEMYIRDSGNRTEFSTGAVRDIQHGKGRCDLMPFSVLSRMFCDDIFAEIELFQQTGGTACLYNVLEESAAVLRFESAWDMVLEVAKHFEDGAKKYGENNWRKGIPVSRYIDSAVRHYIKYMRGDKDEPHDRAFAWNIMCAVWTCENMPQLNEYAIAAKEREGARK